jgi:hypothetical protein
MLAVCLPWTKTEPPLYSQQQLRKLATLEPICFIEKSSCWLEHKGSPLLFLEKAMGTLAFLWIATNIFQKKQGFNISF